MPSGLKSVFIEDTIADDPAEDTVRENGNNTINGERRDGVSIVENSYES